MNGHEYCMFTKYFHEALLIMTEPIQIFVSIPMLLAEVINSTACGVLMHHSHYNINFAAGAGHAPRG